MSAFEDLMARAADDLPQPDLTTRLGEMSRRAMEAKAKAKVVRQHCGDFTTDLACPVCGRWVVEVFSD